MGDLLSGRFSEVGQRHQKGQAHPGQDGLDGVRPVTDPVDDGLDQQKGEQDGRNVKQHKCNHGRDLLSQGFSELEVVQQRHQNGQAHPGQDGLGGVRLVMAPVDDGLDQQKGE